MSKKRRKYQHCQNCNHEFLAEDNYCPECGQENHMRIAPAKELVSDFLGDYFNFDAKIFKTLWPLIAKPGFLTKEYNLGHRVRYLPPIRLYIFISIVFFFVLSLDSKTVFNEPVTSGITTQNMSVDLQDTVIQISDVDSLIDVIDEKGGIKPFFKEYDIKDEGVRYWIGKKVMQAIYEKKPINDMILSNISIMMFFLMPLFAFVLKLLYWRRKIFYIKHLIFSFHFHAFFFLGYTVLLLIAKYLFYFNVPLLLIPIAIVYLFVALKNTYNGRKWLLLLRQTVLLFSYILLLIFGFVFTAFFSIALS